MVFCYANIIGWFESGTGRAFWIGYLCERRDSTTSTLHYCCCLLTIVIVIGVSEVNISTEDMGHWLSAAPTPPHQMVLALY